MTYTPEQVLAMLYTPEQVLAMLSTQPQPELTWYARWFAFLTTIFKFLGIDGWTDTGQVGTGVGTLVRDAQHSTDGFYTIDIELIYFRINEFSSRGKYIRLEVEPFTPAHEYCKRERVSLIKGADVAVAGKMYIDADGPFLEIHPTGANELSLSFSATIL